MDDEPAERTEWPLGVGGAVLAKGYVPRYTPCMLLPRVTAIKGIAGG